MTRAAWPVAARRPSSAIERDQIQQREKINEPEHPRDLELRRQRQSGCHRWKREQEQGDERQPTPDERTV